MKTAETQQEMQRGVNHRAVGVEKQKEWKGEELTLTVFAMHVFVGEGWVGGRGVCSRPVSLCVCLTGKLYPSYLNENRGVNTS